jgi:hypothetical protein
MPERRYHRSSQPIEALTFFLDAARKRLGVPALAVSTPEGRLIAGSGTGLESLVSLGSRLDRDEQPSASMAAIATWRLRVGNQHLLVTTLGHKMTADLGDGVRRILGARCRV